ncbi:DNA helicase/exodeoxyribonuclease V subunit A [Trichococcus patagoniensis]|uniref:ATP-dependent helicase/nuclease subunit A n=1 Tax=Trichococcus patagoniensis TaxID=382641 RepID=A0A2T5IL05_9LACT|nr:helicase-exonuclease AddAB subunit AddA [Trichococcus patagoniensis]PTQ84507.1 DNA helicase/exodeoxyribonuclease V subunit A [Trichococcus patagoniensis]
MTGIPARTPNEKFTETQWQAIYQTGDNILVSASAGSGKTTVLIQRIIEKVKGGTNVDELLVVTFTESAAKEMKERMTSAIQTAINEAQSQEQYLHLIKQLSLMPQANISTIHAFCLKVIQRYFYLIDLDPVFRLLADTIEVELLKEDVWEELKETLYGEPDTFFKNLAKAYSKDRSDDDLMKLVFSLYEFSRANPNPYHWLDSLPTLYNTEDGLVNSLLYQELLKPQMLSLTEGIRYDAEQALHLAGDDVETAAQRELLETEKGYAEQLLEAIEQDDYEKGYRIVTEQLNFARWTSAKKADDDELKERKGQLKAMRDKYKDDFGDLTKQYFNRPLAEQEQVLNGIFPYAEEMARVTKRFSEAYWERKLADNVLDFNDLEHLTLQILAPIVDGERKLSDAGAYYRSKFQEVLIDEYQDVNQLQESILYWVTRHQPETENLFMVGDVKQSIYAFRLADPSLFLRKYAAFADRNGGERIILAENFRSRAEVIGFTNFIFEQLMDEQVGQMAYDEAAKLQAGNKSFPESERNQTELLIYLSETADNNEEAAMTPENDLEADMTIDDKTAGEVTMVAQKIKALIDEHYPIYDKKTKTERPLSFRDIVLLTPTKKNNLVILEIFKDFQIPVILNDTESYFQRTEVSIILSLLKVIDNPRQDIPLAAVLRSPIVGLDEKQLALIRIQHKNGDFYDAVQHFLKSYAASALEQSGELKEISGKLAHFLGQLNEWRSLARRSSLVSLIWTIYNDTHFLDYVGGLVAGKQRTANLHALYERAKKYEETNYKGLFQFIRFIEKIQQRDKDLAEPTSFSDDEDAVRVMTIHASKGLEFPVVFLMDLSKRFNLSDTQSKYIFSETHGLGTDYFDVAQRVQYPSLARQALAIEKKKKLLAEEMRKLYVALTRAEQKLFLIGSYKSEEKMWADWQVADGTSGKLLPDYLRLQSSTLMKWLGMSLYRHQDAENDYFAREYRGELTQYPVRFSISTFREEDLLSYIPVALEEINESGWKDEIEKLANGKIEAHEHSLAEDMRLAVALMEAEYPHQAATTTTSYQSVSEIKRLFEDPDETHMLKLDLADTKRVSRYVEPDFPRPRFMQETVTPTSAEIGTATHFVMQSVDLSLDITEAYIAQLLAELTEDGLLEEAVAKKIDAEQIAQFFETDLGQEIQANADKVKREMPFSLLIPAGRIFEEIREEDGDNLLIHGIIDGFIEYDDYIVLYDFKTDFVGDRAPVLPENIVEKYKGQMNLYKKGLETIRHKPVSAAYLALLSNHTNVKIQ